MRSIDSLVWIDAIEGFWWMNYIFGVKFGYLQNTEDSHLLTPFKAITDTGSTCSYIPPLHYTWLMREVMKDITTSVNDEEWGIKLACTEVKKM